MSREKVVSTILYIGTVFYLVGTLVHQFGITLYPWFVAELYSPYHDTLIAISSLVMAILFFQGARNPDNKVIVDTIMYMATIGGLLVIAMGLFTDFHGYGIAGETKATQSIFEGATALLLAAVLFKLRKHRI